MIYNAINDVLSLAFPNVVIVLAIVIILRLTYIFKSDRHFCLYEEVLSLIFVTYILVLFELVTSQDINVSSGTNLMPFREILRYEFLSDAFYKQVLGNIIMFMPLGFFAGMYCKLKKITSVSIVTLLCSIVIEVVQLYIGRSFDIDDIILNVAGGILGYLALIALEAIERHLPDFLRKNWFKNIIVIALFVLAVLYIFNFM